MGSKLSRTLRTVGVALALVRGSAVLWRFVAPRRALMTPLELLFAGVVAKTLFRILIPWLAVTTAGLEGVREGFIGLI